MKQKEVKLLIVADTAYLNDDKKVIEGLNRFCRRKFDAVICLGENSRTIIMEADCLYPKTAKLCLYPEHLDARPYREFGFIDMNQKIVFQADTSYYGYASHKYNEHGPDKEMFEPSSKADIFITSNNPDEVNVNDRKKQIEHYPEINKYNQVQKPLFNFHSGQLYKNNTCVDGVNVRSCFGILAITVIKEGIPLAEQKKIRAQKRREEKAAQKKAVCTN